MTQIQLRRDTASNWSTNNPIPAQGEPCYETDTNKLKFGDGTTHYNELDYFAGDATPYVLPVASDAVLGGIKVGDGLSITEDGVLSSTGGGTEFTTASPLELAYPQLPNHGISLNDDGTFRRVEAVSNLCTMPYNSASTLNGPIDFSSSNLSGQSNNTIPINNYDGAYSQWEAEGTITHELLRVNVGGNNALQDCFVFGTLEDNIFTMKAKLGFYPQGESFGSITTVFTQGTWDNKIFNPTSSTSGGTGDFSNTYIGENYYMKFGLNDSGNYAVTIYDKATNTPQVSKEYIFRDSLKPVLETCNCVLLPFGYVDTESSPSHYDPEYNKVLSSTGVELWTATIPNTSETPTLQLNYDNTLLVNENNQLSVNSGGLNIPTATSDLTNDSGFITKEVNDLTNYTPTSSLATVATTGSYNDLTDKPTIPSEYVLPTATTTTLGGVKPDGTTITITGDGVISSVGGGGEPIDTYTKEEIDNKLEQKQNAFDCALPLDLLEAQTYGGGCWAKSSGEDEYYYMPSLGLPIQYAGPVVTREGLPMEVQYVPVATIPNASAITPVEYNGAFSDWQSDYHIYYEALKVTNSGDYPNYFFGFCNYFSASKKYAPRGCIYGKTTDSNYTFTMMVDLFGGGLNFGGGNVGFNFRQGTVLATTTIPLTYLDSSLYYLDFHFEGNDFKIDVLKKADNGVAYSASFGLDVVPSFNTASAVIMTLVRNVSSKRIYNANYFKVTDGEGNVVWSPAKQPTYGNNQLVLKYNDTLILSGEELSVNTGNLATKSGNNVFTGTNTFNQSITFGNTAATPEGRTIFDASLGSGLIAIGDTNASLSLRSSGNIQVNSDVMVTSGNVGTYAATTAQGANADTAIANLNGMKFWSGTQTEYDGLESKDNTTLYIITGE